MTTSTGYEYRYYCTDQGDLTTDLTSVIERTKHSHLKTIYRIDTDKCLDELFDDMESDDPDNELDVLVQIENSADGTQLQIMTHGEIKVVLEATNV